MLKEEIYATAIDIASEMVMNEGSVIHISEIAKRMNITSDELTECIGDRKKFFTQASIKVGAKIWAREGGMFGKVVQTDAYKAMRGAEQIRELFTSSFVNSFRGHPEFWRWLYRFEQFVITEKIPSEAMGDYANQIAAFYPIFLEAFEKGLGDGTVRPEVRADEYYAAVTNSLMSICLKYCNAQILATDTSDAAVTMLTTIIDMAVHYLKR